MIITSQIVFNDFVQLIVLLYNDFIHILIYIFIQLNCILNVSYQLELLFQTIV